jgi:hypothetical protein
MMLASALPRWVWRPGVASAGIIGSLGSCPQKAGTCPPGQTPSPWSPDCDSTGGSTIPSGRSTFNGCGPEAGIDLAGLVKLEPPDHPFIANFGTACNHHDCCYGGCGHPKADCDQAFLEEMNLACINTFPVSPTNLFLAMDQLACLTVAGIYWAAVAKTQTGEQAYADGQKEACECCLCAGQPCKEPKTCCNDQCVDAQTDPKNCGACSHACPSGQACCNGACADLQNDAANCGGCGHSCPAGQTCIQGACTCQTDSDCLSGSCCNGRCTDTQSDPANCGGCGTACPNGEQCCSGTCQTTCGSCSSSTDCLSGQICRGNPPKCICPPGQVVCASPCGCCIQCSAGETVCGDVCGGFAGCCSSAAICCIAANGVSGQCCLAGSMCCPSGGVTGLCC